MDARRLTYEGGRSKKDNLEKVKSSVISMQTDDTDNYQFSKGGRPKKDESEKVKNSKISVHTDTVERFRHFAKNNNINLNDALSKLLDSAEGLDIFKTSYSDNSVCSQPCANGVNNECDKDALCSQYFPSQQEHPCLSAKEENFYVDNYGSSGQRDKNVFSPSSFHGNVDAEEAEHFEKIVDAFLYYKIYSLDKLKRELLSYKRLHKKHQQLIPSYVDHMTRIRQCILANYHVLKMVVKNVESMFEDPSSNGVDRNFGDANKRRRHLPASDFNMDKLQSTLRQFVRDWSKEGAKERKVCYGSILNDVLRMWPNDKEKVKILVPGAGLGRLAFEIANLGYICEGNEFSLFMLFCSNFVLNRCKGADIFTLYPWIHQWSNNLTYEDQVRPISVPDIDPCSSALSSKKFSMSAGDFMQIYTSNNDWDGIVTVFFIDTARNVLSYVEKIYDLLKPGGYWINLGPLLYHYAAFASASDDDSIQLPYSELKEASKKVGFEFVEESFGLETTYTENARSLLKYKYECVKFICIKPALEDIIDADEQQPCYA